MKQCINIFSNVLFAVYISKNAVSIVDDDSAIKPFVNTRIVRTYNIQYLNDICILYQIYYISLSCVHVLSYILFIAMNRQPILYK